MSEFTLTFLGTGTSLGIPMIGCDCAVCRSPDARDRRMRASVFCETPECSWVVDTGPDFRAQMLREGFRKLDAVVLTHAHTDHVMGFDDLRPFGFGGRTIPVFGSAPTLDVIKRAFAFAFDGAHRFPGYLHPEAHVVNGPFPIGATTLTPLPVPHGRTTTFGFLFTRAGRKIAAYLPDCKAVPDEVLALIAGVDTVVLDALRHKPHDTHMSVGEALDAAAKIGARQTWFTHLSHDLAHAELEATLPPGVRVAYDGLKLRL